jgi:membrane fusion protein, multidrug efflux system
MSLRAALFSLPGARAVLVMLSAAAPAALAQTEVIVATVGYQRVSERIEALGTLRANESAELTAIVTGTISEIRFNDSQRVREGDVLVAITNREQLAELEAVEAELGEARAQYERVQELAVARSEAEMVVDQRRREVETAEARLKAVQARLSDRLIVAPFDGVVGLRTISVGALVTPGTVVTTLVDDSVMKLDFPLPETVMSFLALGMPLTASTAAFRDENFHGEVVGIDNRIDPVTRSLQVRALIPNGDRRLKPGMLMTLALEANPREALVIPEEALMPVGRENFVFALDPSDELPRVERRRVTIGTRLAGAVEVRDGLRAGEAVVTHGGMRLSDGARVRILAVADEDTVISDILSGRGTRSLSE